MSYILRLPSSREDGVGGPESYLTSQRVGTKRTSTPDSAGVSPAKNKELLACSMHPAIRGHLELPYPYGLRLGCDELLC